MVVAVLCRCVGTVGSIVIGIEGGGTLAAVGVGSAEDIVGTHLLVRRSVAVEPVGKVAGQRVVEHQAVGTVLPLQLGELETLPLAVVAGDKEQDGKKQPDGYRVLTFHCEANRYGGGDNLKALHCLPRSQNRLYKQ